MHLGDFTAPSYVLAFVIVFFAFAIRGMLGFGSGLISVSLLIFLLPVKVVVPIVFLLDTVASLSLGTYDFKEIRWAELPWLWVFTILGLIGGAWVLKLLPGDQVTLFLGVFILLYVGYAFIVKPERLPQVSKVWGAPLGFLGGFIGSLYGGGGPSIVAYLQMRHLDKRAFRASFQFIAITDSVVRGTLYFLLGLLAGSAVVSALWLLPAVVLGLWIGNRLHFRIDARRFQYLVLLVLAATGLKLMMPF